MAHYVNEMHPEPAFDCHVTHASDRKELDVKGKADQQQNTRPEYRRGIAEQRQYRDEVAGDPIGFACRDNA